MQFSSNFRNEIQLSLEVFTFVMQFLEEVARFLRKWCDSYQKFSELHGSHQKFSEFMWLSSEVFRFLMWLSSEISRFFMWFRSFQIFDVILIRSFHNYVTLLRIFHISCVTPIRNFHCVSHMRFSRLLKWLPSEVFRIMSLMRSFLIFDVTRIISYQIYFFVYGHL